MSVDVALLEAIPSFQTDQLRTQSPFGFLNINLWWLFTYVIHLYIALSLIDWLLNTFLVPFWQTNVSNRLDTAQFLKQFHPTNIFSTPLGTTALPLIHGEKCETGFPRHVAIIMDGNRRWATIRSMPKLFGHKAGVDALEKIILAASKIGLAHITVYAFSTENWKRSKEEVDGLLDLLRDYLRTRKEKAKQNKDDIKIHFIGDPKGMPEDIQREMAKVERKTAHKTGTTVHIAFNYGGRDEILRAVQRLGLAAAEGKLDLTQKLSEKDFEKYLDTKEVPDPDLLIRTSAEKRLSNFLLWELAYAEFTFCEKLWPDFNGDDLRDCIDQFMMRQRRKGQ